MFNVSILNIIIGIAVAIETTTIAVAIETTIQITTNTHNQLREFGKTREDYNAVIKRLIAEHNLGKFIELRWERKMGLSKLSNE